VWVSLTSKCFEIRTAAGWFLMKFDINSLWSTLCPSSFISEERTPVPIIYYEVVWVPEQIWIY